MINPETQLFMAERMGFANLITHSEALTLSGVYVPFTDIGGAVLRMLAATRDVTISAADSAELTDRLATMPPHPEVPAALRRLRDHGFRLFTLTDNTLAISGRQLEHAGVNPATSAWWRATSGTTMGAQSDGWQAGLILRDSNAPLGVGPQPDYIGTDLDDVADQLIEWHGAAS